MVPALERRRNRPVTDPGVRPRRAIGTNNWATSSPWVVEARSLGDTKISVHSFAELGVHRQGWKIFTPSEHASVYRTDRT